MVFLRFTLVAAALLIACSPKVPPPAGYCASQDDCSPGFLCIDNSCVAPDGGDGGGDGSTDDASVTDANPSDACVVACGASCCDEDELCVEETCVDDENECTDNEDCDNDAYCHSEHMICFPYEGSDIDHDESCHRVAVAGTFAPTVQCEFREAPDGDPFPNHLHVLSTTMVVDFRIGRTPSDPPAPSIVAVFDDGDDGGNELPTGVLRILDGATCEQQAQLGSLQMLSHSSPPALGDLDGDGRAEIVANKAGGGLVAFRYNDAMSAWEVLWRSTLADGTTAYNPTGGGWSGPSIYDVNDDGIPEVLRGGVVLDRDGRVITSALGVFPLEGNAGHFSVVANVDSDPAVELIEPNHVWQWNSTTSAWDEESWSPTSTAHTGHVAIADLGDYPSDMAWPSNTPEVVIAGSTQVSVQTLDGAVIFGPVALVGGGLGGPPTIADFDGDGRPEFATAGAENYIVYDLDCTSSPIGECASARADGILWMQPSQDESSHRTGSSVFDFEADGRAEAVYGDECFVRVYDGETGDVVFSQFRSSCTWYENPVIADVDGDFNAEIVIGNNFNCGSADEGKECEDLDPGSLDPLFAGLRCTESSECLSGSCVEGLCRCTTDSECCSGDGCDISGITCAAPPAGTPGTGNTCRAGHPFGALGIRVYRDTRDAWVRSRMIWNQHAYFVTNVNEDGTIPRTSEADLNWQTEGLNNFRQNVQGESSPTDAPDATSGAGSYDCEDDTAILETRVCNRGTEPLGAGLAVNFYSGDPDAGGTLICEEATTTVLEIGGCETIECTFVATPSDSPGVTVTVVADAAGTDTECHEGNNRGTIEGVWCMDVE